MMFLKRTNHLCLVYIVKDIFGLGKISRHLKHLLGLVHLVKEVWSLGKISRHLNLVLQRKKFSNSSYLKDAFKIDTNQYVKDLSLVGVEQVTDMFFLALKIQNIGLPKLRNLSLAGCPFITDQGIQWLSENSDIAIQEVFVNMINSKKDVYKTKFAELLTTLQKNEQLSLTRPEASNSCFISYSWVNSQMAVAMGSKSIPGAVGRGDPREIKTFLEGRGLRCWLDAEQVNVIGLLSTAYPKVNFQDNPNEETLETLIRLVQDNMKSEPSEDPDTEDNKDESEENNQISYQEMYELAQRKLLRQVSNHASTHDIGNYPRLFVVDIEEKSSDMGKTVEYQVHTLCECDQGWHSVADPIVLSTEKRNPDIVEEDLDMNDLEDFTPYLSRVAMVMEHNSGFVLDLFTSAEGKRCLKRIQELAMICSDSFQTSYHSLRVKVHKLDTSGQKGKLIRCRLPSGKIIWLCEEHSVQMKVAVLSEEGPEGKHMVANQPWLDAMLEVLRTRATRNHPFEFKNNRKAKRKLTDIIAGVDDVVKNQRRSVLRKHSSLNKTAQQQAMLELSSQDTTVKEETADSKTDKKKEEHKQKKQKDFQEQEKMCVESPSKCSEAGKTNKGDSKEALLELNSQDAAVKEETTDPKTKKKKKERKKKKRKDFQEQENTSVESPTRYSEDGKNNKEDTEEAKMTTKEDGKQLARSVSPNPTPVASSRTASPNTQPDLEARRSTPSPKPREGKKAEKDLGQGSDQQPVQAKSTACVVL